LAAISKGPRKKLASLADFSDNPRFVPFSNLNREGRTMRSNCRLAYGLATVILSLSIAGRANAQLALEVDPLGQTFLTNDGAKDISFDGYLITSQDALLSPKQWSSISDQVAANSSAVTAALGSQATLFGEANPTSKSLAELNIGGPGVLPPATSFAIGYPFAQAVGPESNIAFSFKELGQLQGVSGQIRYLQAAVADYLRLLVGPDGSAWLENTSDAPVSFDGYQLADKGRELNAAGWMSISDYLAAGRGSEVSALLGDGGLGFKEGRAGAGVLTELSASGLAVLQPGATFPLGTPFQPGEDFSSVSFHYRMQGNSYSNQGQITAVPEPTTWLLAAVGGMIALMSRRSSAKCRGRATTTASS